MLPEEERCLQIISDYQRKVITLEEAAPRLRDALKGLSAGINLEMSPSIRRLFAEVARLNGHAFPEYVPEPDRHADGGREMLQRLARSGWHDVSQHPKIDQPLSIGFHFTAASETTARAIAEWLRDHGQRSIEVESPTEADADDWLIRAATPYTRWSQTVFDRWVDIVRNAPLAGDASFMGWGV